MFDTEKRSRKYNCSSSGKLMKISQKIQKYKLSHKNKALELLPYFPQDLLMNPFIFNWPYISANF